MENLFNNDVLEEMDKEGQDTISSQWMITKKEKDERQKREYKGRIVTRGFKEKEFDYKGRRQKRGQEITILHFGT